MKIEVLGPGCARCHSLLGVARQAVARAGLDCEVLEVSNVAEIARRGVLITPALIVNGELKCAGKVPGVDEIVAWIQHG
jgi:small redox-active disulfide protein 2